ncbi:MAG: hypothetical protein JEZ06_02115 [Anaerolineaceae bacterium]|nr:hypothetical protein [Anaerolineaceae bacterium]
MEILNVGPLEIVLILILALVFLGPSGMVEAGAKLGKGIRKLKNSQLWRDFLKTSKDLNKIPKEFVKTTGIDEIQKDLRSIQTDLKDIKIEEKVIIPRKISEVSKVEDKEEKEKEKEDPEPGP